jgi:hypothetical protein
MQLRLKNSYNWEYKDVDIDNNIYQTIKTLNEKKYLTDFCCGGHVQNKNVYIYILFQKVYDFLFLPDGFFHENCYGKSKISHLIYKKHKTTKQIEMEISDKIYSLERWANKLPENTKKLLTFAERYDII